MIADRAVLFGQPPEVITRPVRHGIHRLDTLVLRDSRERGDVLLSNLEFPLYHFLFISNGLQEGRKLRLVGRRSQIEQMMEVLRLTLPGPTRDELVHWNTAPEVREEWVNASEHFALKHKSGDVIHVQEFFETHELDDGPVDVDGVKIASVGFDQYTVEADGKRLDVDLSQDDIVEPPYPLHPEQTLSKSITFGIDVLGGASGFSPEEASTGLVLSFNDNLMLIDSIPFLDQHLAARGVSKNQISSILLTHLHDDHYNLFPLMLAARRIDLITTREIYEMAITKLAMGLGWRRSAVAECFTFVELKPEATVPYYGLQITAHVTVHSIPTIGATFSLSHLGREYRICVVGENPSFGEISEMRSLGLLREETEGSLRALYREEFDLLVADGGMGVIHGNPADALQSRADKVVFVHVDWLPDQFTSTFSLASAGKRYCVVDGDADLMPTRAINFFQANFDAPVPRMWLSALMSDRRVLTFNRDDVILKQGSESRGNAYLILSGECDVIWHDGERQRVVGTRETGDLVGEMAAVTGVRTRNASVVASSPVMVCEFSEETFHAFVRAEGLVPTLRARWQMRDRFARTPVLQSLSTSVIEQLCAIAEEFEVHAGAGFDAEYGYWYLLIEGSADGQNGPLSNVDEGGELPLGPSGWQRLTTTEGCQLARLRVSDVRRLTSEIPQLAYRLRRYRQASQAGDQCEWLL